ncbi:MAG: sulfite exporter TauE/SafE family protein [Clostridia bacterium]
MFIVFFIISLFASTIGAISGIGGGIIIKPVLDATGMLSSETISFMSCCTVLTMTVSSFIRGRKSQIKLDYSVSVWLATGAAVGGVIGKYICSFFDGNISLVQSAILLVVNLVVLFYIKNKTKLETHDVRNPFLVAFIGLSLGLISSFLGIGGGPMNIAVLYFLFSMSPKVSAKNSLFIILFSQITSFSTTVITRTIPVFDPLSLGVMCLGGVIGAILGGYFSKKMTDEVTEKFFSIVLFGLIALNIYNLLMFAL